MTSQTWFAPVAQLPHGLAHDVVLVAEDGMFVHVDAGQQPPPGATMVHGIAVPGFANTHSHAFHRALRGRTNHDAGCFWTWRTVMYGVAARLTPDNYHQLAQAVYAEMACAGITAVGEFHYVHHQPDGTPYANPNAMGHALIDAAREAGPRLTLLDTLYLSGGLTADGHQPLAPEQARFGDGTPEAWAARVDQLHDDATTRIGAAIHSVRAVPREHLRAVHDWAERRAATVPLGSIVPVHAHVSEQPAENQACLDYYGTTPTQLLADAGLLTSSFSAVHATHLTAADIDAYGRSGCCASFCPTTERDLADGIGPARELLDAGARLSLGSDQHVVIDPCEEMRALEMHERLRTHERGRLSIAELWEAATAHDTLGWPDAGRLEPGHRADLVVLNTHSSRTAGCDPAYIVYAATSSDVTDVWIDGRPVVVHRRHVLGHVGALLTAALKPLLESP